MKNKNYEWLLPILCLVWVAIVFTAPYKTSDVVKEQIETDITVTTTTNNVVTTNMITQLTTNENSTTKTIVTTPLSTTTVIEEVTEIVIPETVECVTEVIKETRPIVTEPYVVYKPSTHYVHRNSCRWNAGDVYVIDNTNDIECRLCDECMPDIEIINEYIESVVEYNYSDYNLTDYEITLLRKIVSYEYGSDWVSVYEKAKIVNGVMNRVNDSRYPDTIYGVLTQPYQFASFNPDCDYYISDSIIEAVDYYFAHPDEFDSSNSWWGDGSVNHFYTA